MKLHNVKTALIVLTASAGAIALIALVRKPSALASQFALPPETPSASFDPYAASAPSQTFAGYPAAMIPSISNWPSPTQAVQQFDPTVNLTFGLAGGNQNYLPMFGMVGYSSYAVN